MHQNKTFLAIIPARGGSKRLPGKNLMYLNNKPLIAWTIEAGLKSKFIDKVVVTSDNQKILKIAKEYGADIVKRPDQISTDSATTFSAAKHVINLYKNYDYIILLQPTSPLRNEYHIDDAVELCKGKEANAVISVCPMEHNPLWSNVLPKNGSMDNFLSEKYKNKRSQELERYYRLNGALYICKTQLLLKEGSFFLKSLTYAYIMNEKDSVDIDTNLDFEFAKFLTMNA